MSTTSDTDITGAGGGGETPIITSFANAAHDHADAAGGGQLDVTAFTDDTVITVSSGTLANRPSASAGRALYSATDEDIIYYSNGTTWAIWKDNPMIGKKFFMDHGYITNSMSLLFGGLSTVPTASGTILPADATWTINKSVGTIDTAGTGGVALIGYTFAGAKTKCVMIVGGMQSMAGDTHSLFVQDAAITGAEMDDGYELRSDKASTVFLLREENAGFATLITPEDLGETNTSKANFPGFALAFDSGAATKITGLIRQGSGQWFIAHESTDASFANMLAMGIRTDIAANNVTRVICPVMIYG